MTFVPILLICASLAALVAGMYVWRLTTSRSTLMNLLASSAFLLFAAYFVVSRRVSDLKFVLPFFAAMLTGGRAIAFLWRSRKEPELKIPGLTILFVALVSLIAAISVFFTPQL
jgi:hypothetical protein